MVEIEFLSDDADVAENEIDEELENINSFRAAKQKSKLNIEIETKEKEADSGPNQALILSPKTSNMETSNDENSNTNLNGLVLSPTLKRRGNQEENENFTLALSPKRNLKATSEDETQIHKRQNENEEQEFVNVNSTFVPLQGIAEKGELEQVSVPEPRKTGPNKGIISTTKQTLPEAATSDTEMEGKGEGEGNEMVDIETEAEVDSEQQTEAEVVEKKEENFETGAETEVVEKKEEIIETGVEKEEENHGDTDVDNHNQRIRGLETEIEDENKVEEKVYQVRSYGSKPGTVSINSPDEGDVKYPHVFKWRSYWKPTWCQVCDSLLVGVYKQGLQCSECKQNVHHECMSASDTELPCLHSVVQTVSF